MGYICCVHTPHNLDIGWIQYTASTCNISHRNHQISYILIKHIRLYFKKHNISNYSNNTYWYGVAIMGIKDKKINKNNTYDET